MPPVLNILDRLDDAKTDQLIAHLCARFRGKVFDKEDSEVMRGVAIAFDVDALLGIVKGLPMGKDFLTNYATTIGPFIFIPKHWTRRQKLLVVLHELVHVIQFWAAAVEFVVLYLKEKEYRAAKEAQAYRTEPEAIYVLEGRTDGYTPESTVMGLTQGYALDGPAVTLAEDMSDVGLTSIANGVVTTPPVVEMRDYLAARGGPRWLVAA